MIEVMTTLAHALCETCRARVVQQIGDLSTVPDWYHEDTGMKPCPDAPVATPAEGTIVEVPRG